MSAHGDTGQVHVDGAYLTMTRKGFLARAGVKRTLAVVLAGL
ncbi:hypothetical protein ACQEUX_28870 [Micromonospora sp. CA-259024]